MKSGDIFRIAPGHNHPELFKSFHLIHRDLRMYYGMGALVSTFDISEETDLGGDRRMGRVGLGKASWKGSYMTQAALRAFLDFVDFEDLDCLVTIRTWNQKVFADYNATLIYDPPEDLDSNWCEVNGFLFNFRDVEALA